MRKNQHDLISLFEFWAQSHKAGIPLKETLSGSSENLDNKKLRNAVEEIQTAVKEGRSLSEAMALYPRLFPFAQRSLIVAGEETGRLSRAFEACRDDLKWRESLRRRFVKMLRYPLIVAVLLGLLQLVTGEAEIVKLLLGATLCFVLFGFTYRRVSFFKGIVDNLIIVTPGLGNLVKIAGLSAYARHLLWLYESGMPLGQGLKIAAEGQSNAHLSQKLYGVALSHQKGEALYESFGEAGGLPGSFLSMVRTGENSGRLAETLRETAHNFHDEVTHQLDLLAKTVQPAAIIILGLLFLQTL